MVKQLGKVATAEVTLEAVPENQTLVAMRAGYTRSQLVQAGLEKDVDAYMARIATCGAQP